MVAFYSALSGETNGLADDRPRLSQSPEAIAGACEKHGLQRQAFHVFAPGAEYGPAKRWPAIHFAELAKMLPEHVVLLGSAKEAPLCDEIAAEAGGHRCLQLAGRTSLAEAFALIAGAKSVVSNDSGLMHVAAAFGVPQVAVFGSSSPRHTPPLNDAAKVVWLRDDPAYQPPLDCSPCFERECPLGHTRCLFDVTPERVRALL